MKSKSQFPAWQPIDIGPYGWGYEKTYPPSFSDDLGWIQVAVVFGHKRVNIAGLLSEAPE